MYSDPAWDEYMSTGIDPTGGDLGADFDPETGEYFDEESEGGSYENPFEHSLDSNAHDALADVKAVAKCFWEMRDRRYI